MPELPHVLVIDDDDRLRGLLAQYLRKAGFAVSAAADASTARALLSLFTFDAAVMDVMMPGEDGLQLVRALRATGNELPVLMLSARRDAPDRISGLEHGADDYLTKPFEPKELHLRLQALLKRTRAPKSTTRIAFGAYRFDLHTLALTHNDEPVYLTAAETALLQVLAQHLNTPVSREKLAELSGQGASSERTVDVHITRLRRKIEADSGKPVHIQTQRGSGYTLYGRKE